MEPSIFGHVVSSKADPMFDLKVRLDSDAYCGKIDLGAGVYRDEKGEYYELEVVKEAKNILDASNPGHDYELTTGNKEFLKCAQSLLFGAACEGTHSGRIASVQTISGTGANHLAAVFTHSWLRSKTLASLNVYIGTPAWGNYTPLFTHAGFEVIEYNYYDEVERKVDFEAVVKMLQTAPERSIFVLQGCCHNPTGMDFSHAQWDHISRVMKSKQHLPLIDIAYQGLGRGLDQDAYGVRLLVKEGFEVIVCQSFSKNMGLYSERVGALHLVLANEAVVPNVMDQLRNLIRWEFSSSPSYGARIATIIMSSKDLYQRWVNELDTMRNRLHVNRADLHRALTHGCKTPGIWQHILLENGLFSFLDLTPAEVYLLEQEHHIYLPSTGRINVAGLSAANMHRVTAALDEVLRERLPKLREVGGERCHPGIVSNI